MELRFVVDVNVGRLAKWLRVMGYDAVMPQDPDDGELIRIALREERIILTKDSGITRRRLVTSGRLRAVLVRYDDLWDQVRQVMDELELRGTDRFSRCIRCNRMLEELPREEASGQVPPYVLATQQEFMACPTCGRVYWRGTHWANMTRELAQLGGSHS